MAQLGGRYEIGPRIGGGGMADVYQGAAVGAEGFRRVVAIKRMRAELSSDPDFVQMFVNEARIASKLHHRNIASVYDFDRDDNDSMYLVMEFVDGCDLRTLIDRAPLSIEMSSFVAIEMLRGLEHAHNHCERGHPHPIVHRDVSPHNIMISRHGDVKLVDFGIAKALATSASNTGSLKGKVSYMSPEQAYGLSLDPRSDLFSVGVVFWELLTRQRLFRGGSDAECLSLMLNAPIVPPSAIRTAVPKPLDNVVLALLERRRDARIANAALAINQILRCDVTSGRTAQRFGELARRGHSEAQATRLRSSQQRLAIGLAETHSSSTSPLAATLPRTRAARTSDGRIAPPRNMTIDANTEHDYFCKPGHTATWSALREPADASDVRSAIAPKARRRVLLAIFAACVASAVVARVAPSAPSDTDSHQKPVAKPILPGTNPRPARRAPQNPEPKQEIASETAPSAPLMLDADKAQPPDRRRLAAITKTGRRSKRSAANAPTTNPSESALPDRENRIGTIQIVAKPWANVAVDGVEQRQDAPVILTLPVGKHRIELKHPELEKSETYVVTIASDTPKQINVDWTQP